MILAAVLALYLIVVHGPDDHEIALNIEEISSFRDPGEAGSPHYGPKVHCVIVMANGRYIGTKEGCREVLQMIKEFLNPALGRARAD